MKWYDAEATVCPMEVDARNAAMTTKPMTIALRIHSHVLDLGLATW
jgi:hypothetical protein